jgi:hypothetical protein
MDTIARRVELQFLWADLRARMTKQTTCPGSRRSTGGAQRRDPRAPIDRSHRAH